MEKLMLAWSPEVISSGCSRMYVVKTRGRAPNGGGTSARRGYYERWYGGWSGPVALKSTTEVGPIGRPNDTKPIKQSFD